MRYQSWGRYPKAHQAVRQLAWRHHRSFLPEVGKVLPFGLGRSYGDSCLNDGETVLATRGLNRLIHFDSETGVLRCEAGVSLEDILHFAVPRGWFLPVTPGTKYVTVGGAIANDVHGKNHHRAGTFGCHTLGFSLYRSSGETLWCSPEENSELFQATIGGLGLTGLILEVEIRLKPVKGPYIHTETVKFENLAEFFSVSASSDADFEYTVAWLDCVASGDRFGRGLFMRGNHSERPLPEGKPVLRAPFLQVPFDFPGFALNKLSVKAFNTLYYAKQRQKILKKETHCNPFFYPLDAVHHWNRIYGKKGFFQFQCSVPRDSAGEPIRDILERIVSSGQASFLAVIKEFGDIQSPGMLSFPRPGVTLCLDFPNKGEVTRKLMDDLERKTLEAKGRMYPAKDALMSPTAFQSFYPNWRAFQEHIDPRFSSSFWRRVTEEEK